MPKLDEDELLTDYQVDKNKLAKEKKAAEAARKRDMDEQAKKAAAYMATAEGKADPDAAAHALRKTTLVSSNKAPNSLTVK